MSTTTLIILTVILAAIVIAVLAAALVQIRAKLASTSRTLATLAAALEPAVKAINAQFDVIVGALPGIAAKAAVVAERRPQ